MRRFAALIASLLLAGCTPFQQEWRAPVEPCEVWVIDHHRQTMTCISRERFRKQWTPVLSPGE